MPSITCSHLWGLMVVVMMLISMSNTQNTRPEPRIRPRNTDGLRPEIRSAYREALQGDSEEEREQAAPLPWMRLAPTLPSPEDVDCTISIVETVEIGGRCVRLGGSFMPYACQSGQHLQMQRQCGDIVNMREGGAQGHGHVQSQGQGQGRGQGRGRGQGHGQS